MREIQRIIGHGKRVFVFLGEAGSGKSELAVNWALALAAAGKRPRFFDMDQTKPLFRSREVAASMRKNGIIVDDCRQVLDAPILPSAVFDRLRVPGVYTVLDIGGNAGGAKCIGQFAEAWGDSVAAYLVINCYRPFSGCQSDMARTIEEITAAARLRKVGIISNPNFGAQTTLDDVTAGHRHLESILQATGYRVCMLAAPRRLAERVGKAFPDVDVIGIDRYLAAPWEDDQ